MDAAKPSRQWMGEGPLCQGVLPLLISQPPWQGPWEARLLQGWICKWPGLMGSHKHCFIPPFRCIQQRQHQMMDYKHNTKWQPSYRRILCLPREASACIGEWLSLGLARSLLGTGELSSGAFPSQVKDCLYPQYTPNLCIPSWAALSSLCSSSHPPCPRAAHFHPANVMMPEP